MPIKLKKYDIQNKINTPKEGYIILGFDENGVLVFKDSSGGYRPVVDIISTGYFVELNVDSGLTIGSRLTDSYEGIYSIAQGKDIVTSGESSLAQGSNAEALGSGSTARGEFVVASGLYSYISGKGADINNKLVSSGINSFVHSYSDDPLYLGTYGDYSVILGGMNHNISSNGTNSAIIGGVGVEINTRNTVAIAVSGLTSAIDNAVYMPRLVLVDGTYAGDMLGTIEFRSGRIMGNTGGTANDWVLLDEDSGGDLATLTALLNAEISSRIGSSMGGDISLSTAVLNEISIRSSVDVSLSTVIITIDASISSSISSEVSVRASVDLYIQSQVPQGSIALTPILSTNISSRISYDNSLSVAISNGDLSLSTKLSTETLNRISGDASIETNITNESNTRFNADSSLFTSISTADSTILSSVYAEMTTRGSADDSLSTALSGNISSRGSADDSLSSAIDNEAIDRNNADISLSSAIGTRTYTHQWTITNSDPTVTYSLNQLDFVASASTVATYVSTSESFRWTIAEGCYQKVGGRVFVNGRCQLKSPYDAAIWQPIFDIPTPYGDNSGGIACLFDYNNTTRPIKVTTDGRVWMWGCASYSYVWYFHINYHGA